MLQGPTGQVLNWQGEEARNLAFAEYAAFAMDLLLSFPILQELFTAPVSHPAVLKNLCLAAMATKM